LQNKPILKTMAKESMKERTVTAYLKPSNNAFIKSYAAVQGISESRAMNEAAKALKACQPPETLQRILQKQQ